MVRNTGARRLQFSSCCCCCLLPQLRYARYYASPSHVSVLTASGVWCTVVIKYRYLIKVRRPTLEVYVIILQYSIAPYIIYSIAVYRVVILIVVGNRILSGKSTSHRLFESLYYIINIVIDIIILLYSYHYATSANDVERFQNFQSTYCYY